VLQIGLTEVREWSDVLDGSSRHWLFDQPVRNALTAHAATQPLDLRSGTARAEGAAMKNLTVVVLALCWFTGCASNAAIDPNDADLATLANQDPKADAFSTKLKLLGTLSAGEYKDVDYTGTPKYSGFSFGGTQGDKVEVVVGCDSGSGDPIVWAVDSKFKVLARATAKNDSPDTLAAVAKLTLPATGAYYLITRDAQLQPATMYATVEGNTCTQNLICPVSMRFDHVTCTCVR
jgi:hypothetical protein